MSRVELVCLKYLLIERFNKPVDGIYHRVKQGWVKSEIKLPLVDAGYHVLYQIPPVYPHEGLEKPQPKVEVHLVSLTHDSLLFNYSLTKFNPLKLFFITYRIQCGLILELY